MSEMGSVTKGLLIDYIKLLETLQLYPSKINEAQNEVNRLRRRSDEQPGYYDPDYVDELIEAEDLVARIKANIQIDQDSLHNTKQAIFTRMDKVNIDRLKLDYKYMNYFFSRIGNELQVTKD